MFQFFLLQCWKNKSPLRNAQTFEIRTKHLSFNLGSESKLLGSLCLKKYQNAERKCLRSRRRVTEKGEKCTDKIQRVYHDLGQKTKDPRTTAKKKEIKWGSRARRSSFCRGNSHNRKLFFGQRRVLQVFAGPQHLQMFMLISNNRYSTGKHLKMWRTQTRVL